MRLSIRLAVIASVLALPGAASAQSGDTGYCKVIASKYQRYVVGTSGSGKMATPNVSVETASSRCGSDPAGSIPVLERALNDARIDLPPRS